MPDVYSLLKSPDFVTHDLRNVDGVCVPEVGHQLELVLRKWFAMDSSQEMHAFVRDAVLVGMCFYVSLALSHLHHLLD